MNVNTVLPVEYPDKTRRPHIFLRIAFCCINFASEAVRTHVRIERIII